MQQLLLFEQWRPVAVDPRYEVSSLGRVRRGERTLKPFDVSRKDAYPCVVIANKNRRVHHLVLEAFVGPRPEGMEVRHLDGNSRNNTVGNLAYGTPTENTADRRKHGTLRGNKYGPAGKLTDEAIREARALYAEGHTIGALAAVYGVCYDTMRERLSRAA